MNCQMESDEHLMFIWCLEDTDQCFWTRRMAGWLDVDSNWSPSEKTLTNVQNQNSLKIIKKIGKESENTSLPQIFLTTICEHAKPIYQNEFWSFLGVKMFHFCLFVCIAIWCHASLSWHFVLSQSMTLQSLEQA